MWIFTKYGFFSVVSARKSATSREIDLNTLMVRAREKSHLQNLINNFDELKNLEILETESADYRYRIFTPKKNWLEVMSKMTDEIDYDNFKSKVYNTLKDGEFCHALADVWSVMYNYQGCAAGVRANRNE